MSENAYSYNEVLESYCVFLDILGFSSEILNQKDPASANSHLIKLINALEESCNSIESFKMETGIWDYKIFTDNLVLGTPIKELHSEDYFGMVISDLAEYQYKMVMNSFFVRGGWSIGDLFIGDRVIYGKALIEAYNIECKKSKYPRILLSEDMKKIVNYHINFYSDPCFCPQLANILMDEDGNYFINYLYYILEYEEIDNIIKHKDIIERKLEENINNSEVLDKYKWLAFYHNCACELFLNNIPKELLFDKILWEDKNWKIEIIPFYEVKKLNS